MGNIIEITDFLAPELDVYARLTEAQLLNRHEPEKGLFIAESPKVIERALDAGCVPVSFLVERRQLEGEAKEVLSRCESVPVYTADYEVLRQLTGYPMTRGALCAMQRYKLPSMKDICDGAKRIAILEDVVNPTNVGASNPLYRRAIRVSMGTVFQIPWTFLDPDTESWPEKSMDILHSFGFEMVAMALTENSLSIDDPRLLSAEKLAIVLGTEGDGLASATIANCDYTVRIPMSHGVDSLNVAAASAVAFWELGRKR